jgi:hypothetical protein
MAPGHEQLPPGTEAAYAIIVVFLVLGAGLMSGLTLGLLSLDVLDLRVLQASGSTRQQAAAARLIPLVEKPHWLLCTLLLCNAACMEVAGRGGRAARRMRTRPAAPLGPPACARACTWRAPGGSPAARPPQRRCACPGAAPRPPLNARGSHPDLQALPVFLDRLLDPVAAICLSVTAILLFGARDCPAPAARPCVCTRGRRGSTMHAGSQLLGPQRQSLARMPPPLVPRRDHPAGRVLPLWREDRRGACASGKGAARAARLPGAASARAACARGRWEGAPARAPPHAPPALCPLLRRQLLMWLCAPITWPLGKLLDLILGHEELLMKRQQIKAIVSLHAEGAGGRRQKRQLAATSRARQLPVPAGSACCQPRFAPPRAPTLTPRARLPRRRRAPGLGGKLSAQEVSVIHGAMDLRFKTALKSMTPIDKVRAAPGQRPARRSWLCMHHGACAPLAVATPHDPNPAPTGVHAERRGAAGRAPGGPAATDWAQPRARVQVSSRCCAPGRATGPLTTARQRRARRTPGPGASRRTARDASPTPHPADAARSQPCPHPCTPRGTDRSDLLGLILVKEVLQFWRCKTPPRVGQLQLRALPRLPADTRMFELLKIFQVGRRAARGPRRAAAADRLPCRAAQVPAQPRPSMRR